MDSNLFHIKIFGSINIVLGAVSIALQSYITHAFIKCDAPRHAVGIWCGLIFLLSGIVALIAVFRVKRKPIAGIWIYVLCLSFLSIVFSAVLIGISSWDIHVILPLIGICSWFLRGKDSNPSFLADDAAEEPICNGTVINKLSAGLCKLADNRIALDATLTTCAIICLVTSIVLFCKARILKQWSPVSQSTV